MKSFRSSVLIGVPLLLLAGVSAPAWAGPYTDLIVGDNPVAYWRLGESSTGATAVNSATGTSSAGTAADGSYTSGVVVNATGLISGDTNTAIMVNNATSDRMSTAGFEKFSGGTGSSVEFWTRFDTVPTSYMNLVGDGEVGMDFNLMVYALAGGYVRAHIYTNTGYSSIDTVEPLETGATHHVVSTWDNTTGLLKLYIDGQEAAVTLSAGANPRTGSPVNTDNPIYVGKDGREPNTATAALDEAAVYNRALANTEVAGHYLVGSVDGKLTLPVSYWSFDEAASGTGTAYDLTDGNDSLSFNSATRTSGLIGAGAALFNHTGGGVNVGAGTNNNFSFTTGITVEALIAPDSTLGANRYEEIFRKEDGNNRILFSFQEYGAILSLGLNVNGTYGELDMPLDGSAGGITLAYLTDGNPHHVLGMYDSVTGEKSIWVDGNNVYSTTLSGLLTSGGSGSAYIGSDRTYETFAGVIDEVAIYDSALSAGEIGLHYGNILAGNSYFTIPEPSTAVMLLGLLGIGMTAGYVRRKRKS